MIQPEYKTYSIPTWGNLLFYGVYTQYSSYYASNEASNMLCANLSIMKGPRKSYLKHSSLTLNSKLAVVYDGYSKVIEFKSFFNTRLCAQLRIQTLTYLIAFFLNFAHIGLCRFFCQGSTCINGGQI